MADLWLGETRVVDTFAEAFRMVCCRLVITAIDGEWARIAADECCGYGSSVLGCDAECGVERELAAEATPDGRPGCSVMLFAFDADRLAKAVVNRTGQTLLTAPTTAVFDGLAGDDRFPLGRKLRFFGDGYQHSKVLGERRYWRIPVMDGEFVVADEVSFRKGVAGGNFLIQSQDQAGGLQAARRAVDAIAGIDGAITPFPGGVVRSGSKVGSRYSGLRASTAEAWCPMLRSRVDSQVDPAANCVYEIVIDGLDDGAVSAAMSAGIRAAVGPGIVAIAAGNYGGKLGKHHFYLHQLPGIARSATGRG